MLIATSKARTMLISKDLFSSYFFPHMHFLPVIVFISHDDIKGGVTNLLRVIYHQHVSHIVIFSGSSSV